MGEQNETSSKAMFRCSRRHAICAGFPLAISPLVCPGLSFCLSQCPSSFLPCPPISMSGTSSSLLATAFRGRSPDQCGNVLSLQRKTWKPDHDCTVSQQSGFAWPCGPKMLNLNQERPTVFWQAALVSGCVSDEKETRLPPPLVLLWAICPVYPVAE